MMVRQDHHAYTCRSVRTYRSIPHTHREVCVWYTYNHMHWVLTDPVHIHNLISTGPSGPVLILTYDTWSVRTRYHMYILVGPSGPTKMEPQVLVRQDQYLFVFEKTHDLVMSTHLGPYGPRCMDTKKKEKAAGRSAHGIAKCRVHFFRINQAFTFFDFCKELKNQEKCGV